MLSAAALGFHALSTTQQSWSGHWLHTASLLLAAPLGFDALGTTLKSRADWSKEIFADRRTAF
jgi:hypothetical protein